MPNAELAVLDQVSKDYPGTGKAESVPVLRHLSLQVKKGESLAIVGPSGAGKSTLLHLLGALDTPSEGIVRIQGQDLADLSATELAHLRNREIGFVFQQHYLLPQCSIWENVLLPAIPAGGVTEDIKDRAHDLLVRVGLKNRMEHRPGQLSGGECQRVAVVRALINQPSLILADEPGGSLDPSTAENLSKLLVELNNDQHIALVVVTHSWKLARCMRRQLFLDHGSLQPLPESQTTFPDPES